MIRKLLGKLYLALSGWSLVGEAPPTDRYVLVAAPHTSNHDYAVMKAASWAYGRNLNWLGKHTLFEGFTGRILLRMGGVPVDRRASNGLVEQLVERFAGGGPLELAIPPSGTRGYRDYWKSGFYHIALQANVPLVFGLLDFKTMRCGYGDVFYPTGDIHADMEHIRQWYAGIEGKHPERQARIRVRSEDPAVPPADETPPGEIGPAADATEQNNAS